MQDDINVPNPTGIKRSQAENDESTRQRYWQHAIEYGLDYYVAGRFATAHHFNPVSANILHHAAELLLKACLAYTDPLPTILNYRNLYRHDIRVLWAEFRRRCDSADPVVDLPTDFDAIVDGLQAFEAIRYPETLIINGATISIGLFEVENPILRNGKVPDNAYILMLPQIDRLMGLLFNASHANPPAFLPSVTDDQQASDRYARLPGLFGRDRAQEPRRD